MSKKCRAFSTSKLGLEPADNRKAFYVGWGAALAEPVAEADIGSVWNACQHREYCRRLHVENADVMVERDQLRAEVERLREALSWAAMAAHSGGLASMSQKDALIAVRRITLPYWDRSMPPEKVRAALARKDDHLPLVTKGCLVCGIGAGGVATGYACTRGDCPTRVTCGG